MLAVILGRIPERQGVGGRMIPGINANPTEEKAIRSAFAPWAAHFRRNLDQGGLAFLLDSYERLVRSLETERCEHSADYASCCGDYCEFTNDVSVRDAIEIVLDAVSDAERTRIANSVAPIDERYRSTQLGTDCFLNSEVRGSYPQAKYWWYYGLPRSVHW